MSTNPKNTGSNVADTGNASNPTPHHEPVSDKQLLEEKAEKYLRESGNIEDMPDAQEQQDAEDSLKKESRL